jgi:iron-sulfur cluster assembly accessory protein
VVQATEPFVKMTPRAEGKMASLMKDRGIEAPVLRVFASPGGGCGGGQFGMSIAESQEADDLVIALESLTLIVDPRSAPLLDGAEIDFVESALSAGFTIFNPNAAAGCDCSAGGCGPGAPPSCC